jgi:hypothetical protein
MSKEYNHIERVWNVPEGTREARICASRTCPASSTKITFGPMLYGCGLMSGAMEV